VKSEESTTPGPAELVRRQIAAAQRRDFDAPMSFSASDPVWDMSPMRLGIYEGPVAIRRFLEEWIGGYEEWENEPEEALDLGGVEPDAAQMRVASLYQVRDGKVIRHVAYMDRASAFDLGPAE
jgi:hypothetical protein